MEVRLTPEQEAKLSEMASFAGVDASRLVQDAVSRLIEDEESRFRADVRKGIEQADRGEFIEEAEMDARVSRILGD